MKSFGVYKPKKIFGKEFLGTARTSFLIDKSGKIAKIYEKVNPAQHVQQVLKDLANI